MQKVFKSRLDEGRSHARLADFSNSFTQHNFITAPKASYEGILSKNKNSFFDTKLYVASEAANKKSSKPSVKKKSSSLKELNENLKLEQDKYIRLFAEFENYKRRTSKERIELYKTAGKEILTSLVPVLEDFKRALNQDSESDNDEGIKLIYNKFNDTLKNQGLIEVEVNIGDIFDPEIHEAISQIPAIDDKQKGKIIDIIQGGYKLGDIIINFPKVVVAQ
jgi:molecular chaperone GrpE